MTIVEGSYGIGFDKQSAFIITCDVCQEARLIIPKFLGHATDAETAWEYHGTLCGWESIWYDDTGVRDPGHRCRMCSRPLPVKRSKDERSKSKRLLKSRGGK